MSVGTSEGYPAQAGRPVHEPRAESRDVDRVMAALGPLPGACRRPALLVVSGLPGTGKSRFCRQVQARTGAAVLESDALRRELFGQVKHSSAESRRLFAAIHGAIDRLLAENRSAILDATNLAEREREPLCAIADKRGARLLLVQIEAPPEVVRRRLRGRSYGEDPQDQSRAGIDIYHRMVANREEIRRPHRVVDTSRPTEAEVESIAEEMESP